MITKTNERIIYKGSHEDDNHQISANITTSTDGTLTQIESGIVTIDGQNVADFSLSPSDYLFMNCYNSANTSIVADYINSFINLLKTDEDEN